MKRTSRPVLTNLGPRQTPGSNKQEKDQNHHLQTSELMATNLFIWTVQPGGVPVGNVLDQKCSHLEWSRRNNHDVQTCTKG